MDRSNEANIRYINAVSYDFEKSFLADYDIRIVQMDS